MTSTAEREPLGQGFRHEAFVYSGATDFVAGTGAFVRRGLEAGEAVVAALPAHGIDLLRTALGADADAVEFLDMVSLGANPARIIPAWNNVVDTFTRAGRPFRGIGEPVWVGRPEDELDECLLHEHLLNVAFEAGPAWQLFCPYDASRLPASAVAAAKATHPVWSSHEAVPTASGYDCGSAAEAFAQPLPAAPADAASFAFGPSDLVRIRALVSERAAGCGITGDRCRDLVLAASELATNSLRYGGGGGLLRHWHTDRALIVDFVDDGLINDLLAGRRLPALAREGGRGLFLVNQICDFVQVRSSARGTHVRVSTRRPTE